MSTPDTKMSALPPLLLLYGSVVTAIWLLAGFEVVEKYADLKTAIIVDRTLLASVFLAIFGAGAIAMIEARKKP